MMQNYNFKIIRIISMYLPVRCTCLRANTHRQTQTGSYISIAILLSTFYFLFSGVVFASETNGAITSGGNNGYAWSDQTGWVNFGATNGNINITDSGITGNAWSINYGWINMSPTNGGVTVAANGALSGYAWGSGLGWINFSGVFINSSGKFTGQASGTTIGALTFDCTNCSVITDYRPQNFRTTTPSSGGGGGIIQIPPIPPEGGFKVFIDNNIEEINTLTATLRLFGGSNIARMAISERADFQDAGQETYQETKSWTFSGGEGVKTIYVKFYTSNGIASEAVSDSIIFKEIAIPSVSGSGESLPGTGISAQTGITEIKKEEEGSPEEAEEEFLPAQLFDINLEIENTKIAGLKDLVARVLFTSFGRVPTPVDLTFDILNESGEKVYSAKDEITVQTQAVLTKRFADTEEILGIGKYTLLVTTLYNVDVTDEFSQDFEIAGEGAVKKPFWRSLWFWGISIIALIIIFIVAVKKLKDNE